MRIRIATSCALVLLLAGPAVAQETFEVALARMAESTGDEYLAARKAVLETPGARERIDALLVETRWSRESFGRLSAATIARSYLAQADVVAKVNHLQGVDPEIYTKRRRADPECGRELRALGSDAVGPMLELWQKTFDRYPFAPAEGPEGEARRAKERLALREGLVIALSTSKHPAAIFVCREAARNESEAEAIRVQAIEGLGSIGTAEALNELVRLHAQSGLPEALRLAAVRGVALVPSAGAFEFLGARLSSTESVTERKTVVVSLGTFGSAWAWEARGDAERETADRLRREASALLVRSLEKLASECGDEVIDALATIAHESSLELLAPLASEQVEGPAGVADIARRARERVQTAVERNKR